MLNVGGNDIQAAYEVNGVHRAREETLVQTAVCRQAVSVGNANRLKPTSAESMENGNLQRRFTQQVAWSHR